MPASRLDAKAISQRLSMLPGWSLKQDTLCKRFEFADFVAAFRWMARIAEVAEGLAHHPDWRNVYNTVQVRLSTHDADGLTELDFALAQSMDDIFAEH
jgi:4a-hydroxytetrahydrobiopterin dehydratase